MLAARFLLPAEYGIYSLGVVFITLIQTLTYTGFYHFIVTSKLDDKTVLGTSFWMIFGLATAASALLAAAAFPISWLYEASELGPVLILLAAIQPVAGASAWYSAVLLRRQAINLHFTIMFLQNALALVGGVTLLWLWQSLYALVAFRYVRVLTGFVLYVVFARDKPGLRFDRTVARTATGFSGGLYGARFMNFLSRYGADLLLGYFFTTAEAGLYRFGNRVASGGIDIVAQPMRSFALTQFGAAGRKDQDLAGPLRRFVGSITLLTGIVAAILIVYARDVVAELFNPAYLAALVVTYALAVRAVTMVGSTILEPAMAAKNKTGSVMLFNTIWTGLTVASAFVAAPLGLEILAWSQATVATLASVSALFMLRRRAGIEIGGALRSMAVALAIVVLYGLALHVSWPVLAGWFGPQVAFVYVLAAGLLWAVVAAVPVLVLGWRLRVFSLSVFSG